MSDGAGERSVGRVLVGKPRVWVSGLWCAIGVTWLVLAIVEPALWRFLLGAFWIVAGTGLGIVALSDRRHRRGYYADR